MRYITNLYTTETWRPVTYYLQAQKFTRFTKYELKKKIKTNQMKINTLYNK